MICSRSIFRKSFLPSLTLSLFPSQNNGQSTRGNCPHFSLEVDDDNNTFVCADRQDGSRGAVALVDPLPLGQRRLLVSPIPAMLCRGSIQHLSSALFVWRAHFSQSMPSECEGANRSCLSQDTVTSAAPISVSLMLNCTQENSIRDIAAKANLSLSPNPFSTHEQRNRHSKLIYAHVISSVRPRLSAPGMRYVGRRVRARPEGLF